MRKLRVEDIGRFCYFVKTAKAKACVEKCLMMAAETSRERKAKLRELEEKARTGDAEAARAYQAALQDDDWTTSAGIRGFLEAMDCAAEAGAMASLYKFLAPVFEITPDQVAEMELEPFLANVREMLALNNFKAFFDVARKTGM